MPFYRFPGLIERVLLEPQALTAEEIAARVENERPLLDLKACRAIGRKPQDFAVKLPLTARYETALPASLAGQPNRVFRRETIAGQPRVTVDGVPMTGLAMMPSPYVKPEETAQIIVTAAAGAILQRNLLVIRALNDWYWKASTITPSWTRRWRQRSAPRPNFIFRASSSTA